MANSSGNATRLVTRKTSKGKKLTRMMRIETEDGKIGIDIPYAPMNVTYGGFGREWVEVERDGRNPVVVSTAMRNRTLSFDIYIGQPGTSVDPYKRSAYTRLDILRKLSETSKRIRIYYDGMASRYWHLTEYSFESERRASTDSAVVGATASLTFIAVADFVSTGPVTGGVKPKPKSSSSKKKSSSKPKPKKRYHTVKRGDTLSGLAVKYYKNATKWRKIADANKIKNPNTIPAGKRLWVP